MKPLVLILALSCVLTGCSIGDAPTGGSDAEIKSTFDSMPLEEKAKFYLKSPMPAADKKKKIEEIYQQAGKPVPADIAGQIGGSGAPVTGAPTG